ncbi:antitoxin VapB1 [Pseudonocardia ailaonensis]|uniref:Antitoxin VapB1 n=1 Tax=Pseudonocardia ailaonensis TaxID=367279 RepID=A0ABN2MWM1_9PSEU
MATIQIRDIPDEDYETLSARARAAGQSLQVYMRDLVVSSARFERRETALFAELDAALATDRGTGVTSADVVTDLHELREGR